MRFLIAAILSCIALSCVPEVSARQSTETAFSPSPEAVKLVERTIAHAEDTVDVAAYSFTSQKIADALIDAHQRGVKVRILLDKAQRKHGYKSIRELEDVGIPIRINSHFHIMHDKYLIIDQKTVETGSFNFTVNAEKHNAENVIVIKNNKKLAKEFMENWQKLWDEGEDYE